ncbi:MAG: M14 family metallopeptidase [Phenylobacterium sp.]|uniref:M14 family metallopeptidase n=1 Tax=Phenylobacterium sp. TaxID=1871053 RepID=UPI003016A651
MTLAESQQPGLASAASAGGGYNVADSFSVDYGQGRTRFQTFARECGGLLEAIEHPEPGPDGARLYCDTAWFGPRSAERVLVLISGTHGVEGFCGSGAQVDLLRRRQPARLPDGVAVLMIHAINPYGFAWLSRVTHENVDLNRNWVDFAGPLPVNAGYDELSASICPDTWSDGTRAELDAAMKRLAGRVGASEMELSLTRGQYDHPRGIYYGGTAPTWSRKAQTEIFSTYLRQAGRIAIIDYHTGLGPRGFAEQIVTQPRDAAAFSRARSWYGAAVTSTCDGSAASVPIEGDGLSAAAALLPHAQVTAMALEVGTLRSDQVLQAVIADNWLRARGDVGSPLGRLIKAQIRAAFYCDHDDWKGMVVGQSMLACRQAIAGLLQV